MKLEKPKPQEEYNILDKNMTPEKRDGIIYSLRLKKETALGPIEGEIEKTEEEVKFIKRANKYLDEELKELGVTSVSKILPEQIHFLSEDLLRKKCLGLGLNTRANAFFWAKNQAIYINKHHYKSRFAFYRATFHEMIHGTSFLKFCTDKEGLIPYTYRSGYAVSNPTKRHEHFRGLNEMVIDKMVFDIFQKHQRELEKKFNIAQQDMPVHHSYYYSPEIIDVIVEKISEKNNEKKRKCFKKI